ncbi:MAG: hypothetical protein Q8P56_01465 [Candidatus Uhrbacteria bacterium]|nr:hypothetical protein [Candidatus Uhrbacteria bacterium]
MSKVIIVRSLNLTPEEEVEERITPLLNDGYRVVSASTSLHPIGEMDINEPCSRFTGVARHMYYVTTVVLEKHGS